MLVSSEFLADYARIMLTTNNFMTYYAGSSARIIAASLTVAHVGYTVVVITTVAGGVQLAVLVC